MGDGLPHGELLAWRGEFPILDRTTYLISNSLGAMPRGVHRALARYAGRWEGRGVRAWHEGWWELPVTVGDLFAPILGVQRGAVSLHPNVTLATAVFLSCFDFPPHRARIVNTALNFPSLTYLLDKQRPRGAEVVVVPSDDGIGVPTERLLAAIDERARLVVISHVLFRSAFVQDAAAVARRCREVGAHLLLDCYQSAGVLPLALEAWGVDAAVGGTLKWLCGGPGVAYLYVRPGLAAELEPALTGWQADREPFAFRPGSIRIADPPWRFLTGTPNVPGLHACLPGLEIVGRLDPGALRRRSLALTDLLIGAAEAAGFEVRTPRAHEQRGGTVTVWHPRAEALSRGLLDAQVLCDYRPGAGIRLSPHFYNTADECRHAIARLADLARQAP